MDYSSMKIGATHVMSHPGYLLTLVSLVVGHRQMHFGFLDDVVGQGIISKLLTVVTMRTVTLAVQCWCMHRFHSNL